MNLKALSLSEKIILTLFALAEILVFYLSLMPRQNVPSVEVPGIDKVVHFLFYFGLSLLILDIIKSRGVAVLVALALFIQGWGIEFLQEGISNRFFDIWDGFANGLGALSGLALSLKVSGSFTRLIEKILPN